MFKVFMEAASNLPKLSQTSIYNRFDQTSGITNCVKDELVHLKEYIVKPDAIQEMISLMKLNGDPIVKKAIEAYVRGDIIVTFNPGTSKIPATLPFIIVNQGGNPKCFMFAEKVCTKLNNQTEYTNFMAALEASYLALSLYKNPGKFISNRNMMIVMCDMYTKMVTAPLEQRIYMKGENLVKAELYVIAYFYRMIDGDKLNAETIPVKRLVPDKIQPAVIKQIVNEVKSLPDMGFFNVINLIKQINPVRYKNLDNMYLTYFTSSCGMPLIFALENLGYLFLLMTSASYKTAVTQYNLNKYVGLVAKKALKELNQMGV
jgi:hypothetical protein